MDSMLDEPQSSNQIDIATQLPYSTGSVGSETPFYSKMEFSPGNEIPPRLNTFSEPSSYWMEIHEKTQSFQSDFQNGKPLRVLHYSTSSKTDMQFHETESYQIPASHDKVPLIYTDNTPGVTSLDPSEAQTRMPSFWVDIPSDSNKVHQSHKASAINEISPQQTGNPTVKYTDKTPELTTLEPTNTRRRMPAYGAGIRSDSYRTHQSCQASFTKVIFPQETGNPREMHTDKTPELTSLHPRNTQRRMPPYEVGIRSDSKKVHQSRQAISTNEISPLQTENAKNMYPNNTPGITSLDSRETQTIMPSHGTGIRSDSCKTHQSQQASSANVISSLQTGNPREMFSENTPGVTSLDQREAQKRMPSFGVGTRSDSDNTSQSNQASFTNGIPSNHTDHAREINPDQTVNTDEMRHYQVNADKEGVSGQEKTNKRLQFYQKPCDKQKCVERETSSHQTSRSQEVIPLYQNDFQNGTLNNQADAGIYEEMKPSYHQNNANGKKSPNQPIISEQMSHNVSGTRTCPRCHCLVTTQPPFQCLPSLNLQKAHVRPSVIMVPLNRKLEKTEETLVPSAPDQEWTARRETPTENEDSESSRDDDEHEQERYFRVNIGGTTARFKLTKEDWARMPVKSLPSGGRSLSGHWTHIFANKMKESNPWCSVRFNNNHVRSANSRKIHSAVFFRGAAECKHPECNVKMKFVIRKEYGKRVEVTYVGNVCHVTSDQPDVGRCVTGSTRGHEAKTRAAFDHVEVNT